MASTFRLWTTKDVTTCTELMPTFNNSRQNCQHRKMKTVEQKFNEERLNGPASCLAYQRLCEKSRHVSQCQHPELKFLLAEVMRAAAAAAAGGQMELLSTTDFLPVMIFPVDRFLKLFSPIILQLFDESGKNCGLPTMQ